MLHDDSVKPARLGSLQKSGPAFASGEWQTSRDAAVGKDLYDLPIFRLSVRASFCFLIGQGCCVLSGLLQRADSGVDCGGDGMPTLSSDNSSMVRRVKSVFHCPVTWARPNGRATSGSTITSAFRQRGVSI